jgi:hypothetical protein
MATSLGACVFWGAIRTYPGRSIRHEFRFPNTKVVVAAGDIFNETCNLAVGFSDTFDTSTDDHIISAGSAQGQMLDLLYNGDSLHLDGLLESSLNGLRPTTMESRQDKVKGKLKRYPIGTVAILQHEGRKIFCVAYSCMGNDLVARSSVNHLWKSLDALWTTVYQNGEQETLAMPALGAGLARIDALDLESILRTIILSFLARSRQNVICRELRIVLHPHNMENVNLHELLAFIKSFKG